MIEASSVAARFVPGTNRKGDVAGANWTFALPSLELDHVVVAGSVDDAALRTYRRLATRVTVLRPGDVAPAEQADLLVLGRDARPPAGVQAARTWREHRGDGAVTLEPWRGEVQTVVPSEDDRTLRWFRATGAAGPSSMRPLLRDVEPRLARRGLVPRRAADVALPRGVPAWLASIAADDGVDLGGWRWGLAARGRYASRKVLVWLFEPDGAAPTLITKVTRDGVFNDRLDNERDALGALAGLGMAAGHAPTVAFSGRHGGLAVLGEGVLDGVPFRRAADGRADCAAFGAALDWFVDLASRSADRTAVAAGDVAALLAAMVARAAEVYGLPSGVRSALEREVEVLASSRQDFPTVFEHGDAGTWNALRRPDGSFALLDWEAADRRGLPLWDLLYFVRSYATGTGIGRVGRRDSLDTVVAALFEDTPLARRLTAAVRDHVVATGLDPALVAPLYHACWLHRALKEATRLRPDRLARGHYIRLLVAGLERRDAPGLRRLLDPDLRAATPTPPDGER